jgi:hypothetical protein
MCGHARSQRPFEIRILIFRGKARDDPEGEVAEREADEYRSGQREPAADAQGETEPAAVLARQVKREQRAGPSGAPVPRVLDHALQVRSNRSIRESWLVHAMTERLSPSERRRLIDSVGLLSRLLD